MSSNLFWEPVVKVRNSSVSDKAKYALRIRFGDGFMVTGVKLDSSHLEYLEGMRDAGIDDIGVMVDAIHEHGEIRIFEE